MKADELTPQTAALSQAIQLRPPPPEPPMPPNDLVPYEADIFGLEDARRDCRFEMIKIVREVGSAPFSEQHHRLTMFTHDRLML